MSFETALVSAMARRCGLEDPDAFAAKGGVWGKPDTAAFLGVAEAVHGPRSGWSVEQRVRGTGRTTRTLLQALCALEVGCSVEVVAADPDQAKDLRGRLHALAFAAGLQRDYVVGRELWITWPGREANRGRSPMDLRLVDHYAAEVMSRPATLAVLAAHVA